MAWRFSLVILFGGLAYPAEAAAAWRVQQACAMQRFLSATPAFPTNSFARDASAASLSGEGMALRRRQDPAIQAHFEGSMRSGRAFADRAAADLARREKISHAEAVRRIGADPGPWPVVTPRQCDVLETRAEKVSREVGVRR